MTQHFTKYIYNFFNRLIESYEFIILEENDKEQSYFIKYASKNIVIQIEKYFREFYVTIYKIGDQDKQINLSNLLEFLNKYPLDAPSDKFFHKEKDLEECYKKQLSFISSLIYDNLTDINDFFISEDYDIKMEHIEKIMMKKWKI
jgi:hypothetical protein